MAIEKTIILNVDTDGAVDSIQEVDKSIDQVDDATKDLTGSFDRMTGGLISGFRGAVSGIRKGVVAMKSLKVAIAATGVGLLVIAIGSLVFFFTKTERGGKKLEVVMAQIGAAIAVIVDRVILFGEAIFKFFSGDTKGAIEGVKASFQGLGDEIVRDIRLAKELKLATQALIDVEIDQITLHAIRRKLIAENRFAAKQRSKSIEERIAALTLAQALETANLEDDLANQKIRVGIAQDLLDMDESSLDQRRAVEEEKAKLIDLTTASIDRQRTVESELQSLLLQAKGDGEEIDFVADPEAVRAAGVIQVKTDLETDYTTFLLDENIIRLDNQKKSDQAIIKNTKESSDIIKAIKDEEREYLFDQVQNLLFGIEQLAGRGTTLAKSVGIANVLIDTYRAIISTWAGYSSFSFVGTAAAIVQTAAIVVMGAAAIKNITSVKSPSAGGGGGSVSSISQPPTAPQFNIVGTAPENQLANTINEQQERPVQAFVVASEVSTQQALDRNKVETASFGN